MPDDKPLKSAFELAMERLRSEDDGPRRELSAADKAEIARLREEATAKLAEVEIMHRQTVAEAGGDPEKLAEAEEHYRIDRERIESARDSGIAKIRRGDR